MSESCRPTVPPQTSDTGKNCSADQSRLVAEIDVIVLRLDRPVVPNRPIQHRYRRPADSILASGSCEERRRSPGGAQARIVGIIKVCPRHTGLSIDQLVVVGDTDRARCCGGPLNAGRQRSIERRSWNAKRGRTGSAGITPGDIAFPAHDELADLITIAAFDTADERTSTGRLDARRIQHDADDARVGLSENYAWAPGTGEFSGTCISLPSSRC